MILFSCCICPATKVFTYFLSFIYRWLACLTRTRISAILSSFYVLIKFKPISMATDVIGRKIKGIVCYLAGLVSQSGLGRFHHEVVALNSACQSDVSQVGHQILHWSQRSTRAPLAGLSTQTMSIQK